jgi:hypothetical protein
MARIPRLENTSGTDVESLKVGGILVGGEQSGIKVQIHV